MDSPFSDENKAALEQLHDWQSPPATLRLWITGPPATNILVEVSILDVSERK
ncbi:MAG TPA: hypothetical protein VKC61_10730 [Pyrinomonadaceae bacterium]|nr:hypothetical protein [Pyrinomonadaceae bacterium]